MTYIIIILLVIAIYASYAFWKIVLKNDKIADQMHNALGVIIQTRETLEWLEENDPMALRQATIAFERYETDYDN